MVAAACWIMTEVEAGKVFASAMMASSWFGAFYLFEMGVHAWGHDSISARTEASLEGVGRGGLVLWDTGGDRAVLPEARPERDFTLDWLPAGGGAVGFSLAAWRASRMVVNAAIPGVEISRDTEDPTEEWQVPVSLSRER